MIADDPSGESWRTEFHAHLGGLFKIKWHRVVLDEAHAIKTVSTQSTF
jgi:SNF2 family DNA or RNA helicase